MANTIRIKRSTGSSAPGSLENAELAFAEGSKKLFVGVGTGGSGGSATTIEPIGGSGSFADLFTSRTQNTFLAAPNGSNGAATFRAMVAADVPSLAHTKISDFDTGVQANRLDQMAAPTGSVSMNSQTITNLADPVNASDAATKSFVEATSQGLDVKDSCVAATTANITISTALNNGDTLDGVSLSTNDRVLVKDQSTASENGIYIVGSSPARASDLAAGADAAGFFTFVEQGTVNADNGFVCTSNKGSAVVGTNNLTIAQFSGAGQVTAGDGLDKSGNTLSLDLKANGGLVIESTEVAVDLAASSITGTLAIGDGGTGATSASAARTALGLAIGTNVQAYDADLDNLSGCQSGASAALAALTSTEVAILDGATVSTAELNIIDGDTSATSTTLAAADRLVTNDAGTMKQVALSDLVTFLEDESASSFNIDGGSY
tara:strand:+ start:1 stop:1305 length:1305 start_codon:yes stop_codon:yes gene_type:complete